MSNITAEYTVADLASISDIAVDLTAGEMTRKMAIGADWTVLCVGVLLGSYPLANYSLGANGFRMGLTTGTSLDIAGGSPHWLGVSNNLALTVTYNALYEFYANTGMLTYLSRTGVLTLGTPVSLTGMNYGGTVNPSTLEARDLVPAFVVFTRDSASQISIQYIWNAGDSTYVTPTKTQFIDAITAGTSASLLSAINTATGGTFTNSSMGAVTGIDEATDGDLDSVSFVWPHLTQTMSVFLFAACKWS